MWRSLVMWVALYLYGVGEALTCLFNALRGKDPHQSTSAWAYYAESKGLFWGIILRPLTDFIFSPIEKDHCRLSWQRDRCQRLNAVSDRHRRWRAGAPIIFRD